MQNNKINQEGEEPKSLLKRFADWLDAREERAGRMPVSFMLGLLLVELVGFGLFIMLATCSLKTIVIVSVSTVIGLIVLCCLDKLIRKILFRKKSRVIELSTSGNNKDLKESLIIKTENLESSTVKTESITGNINNIIEEKKDQT